ncbi:MAG: serine hydrolase [Alphaproteobacteria bacterium]|nr:serine hydrolase [Alphaproteobacteria bacterium]
MAFYLQRYYHQLITGISLVFAFALALSSETFASPMRDWPDGGTHAAAGESEGIDPVILKDVHAAIANKLPLTRSILIVRNGSLVSESYFGTANGYQQYKVASVTKSVVSALLGIAIAEGKLAGTHLTVSEVYPEESRDLPDTRTNGITLDQLLTMRSGLGRPRPGEDLRRHVRSRDRFRSTLRLPQLNTPGRVFKYDSANSHLVGGAIARATGESLLDYANAHLFGPMGEKVTVWRRDPLGHNFGGWGMELTPRQMAKLGLLILNKGKWGARQVVPEAWLRDATKTHVRLSESAGYGYYFWIRTFAGCEAFYAAGRGGQYIVMVPDASLIVVVTTNIKAKTRGAAPNIVPMIERVVAATGASCVAVSSKD